MMYAGFITFCIIAAIVTACLITIGIMDKEWFPFQVYILGVLLTIIIIALSDETSQSVAEKHNIDYALVEAIAEVTDESEYDVAVTLSVAGTENIKIVFDLTDEEMTAIEVLTREEK